MTQKLDYDVLVIGSGAAGLSLALRLAPAYRIAVLCKNHFDEGATYYAQGGIAAVLDEKDSVAAHVADTLKIGCGLSDPKVAQFTAEQAKSCVQWLIDQGVAFTQEQQANGEMTYHLTREGGHSHRRIIHAADATGRALQTTLAAKARQHPNIQIFEHCTAIDLIMQEDTCTGAYVFFESSQEIATFLARATVLATGGASKVYLHTSNPDVSNGDGIAMAWRAGCSIANMEFNQFHPTCLYYPAGKSFLITEAMRGEGAYLLLPDGTRFMPSFDPRAELAPRDVVARAIDHEMKRLKIDCVYLDISHKPREFIVNHFPTIYARCLELGIDITQSPIPVVPAAHYTCGGVMTDLQGHTDKKNLYAIGETAFTGLHGANRIASNSLLECLVFAKSASEAIAETLPHIEKSSSAPDFKQPESGNDTFKYSSETLRQLMWEYVGIIRNNAGLNYAEQQIDELQKNLARHHAFTPMSCQYLELRNMALVAELIVRSALMRHESRGLHYTLDYPESDPNHPAENTVLRPSIPAHVNV